MTRDDVTRMAREAGFVGFDGDNGSLRRFATLVAAAEREKVAKWMIQRSYATGHGDTTEDLLAELEWQIAENWTQAMVKGVETEREACAKVCETYNKRECYNDEDMAVANKCAFAIRARGAP